MEKYVYSFNEGSKNMRRLLGGKGANLCEMTGIGLPVPFGFVVTTEACKDFYQRQESLSEEIKEQIYYKLSELEEIMGKKFGNPENPLLLSVRSGAPVSMPGMMDTVLNLGMNDEIAQGLGQVYGDMAFAYRVYLRFIRMYGQIVMGVPKDRFAVAEVQPGADDINQEEALLKDSIAVYKKIIREYTGEEIHQDPKKQLLKSLEAVFASWENDNSVIYRRLNDIDHSLGTAVTIQSMVFGNLDDRSLTGVAFTRNPIDGEKKLYGEVLMAAQGEDVVSGSGMPYSLAYMEKAMPETFEEFNRIAAILEKHFNEVQDIEFTVESGKIYILQSKNAKKTAEASINSLVDMVEEGMISKKEAINRIETGQIKSLLNPRINTGKAENLEPIAKGLPASPGAYTGCLCLSFEEALKLRKLGLKSVLVLDSIPPGYLKNLISAGALVTSRGGTTSHISVMARSIGKPYICSCQDMDIDHHQGTCTFGNCKVKEGDMITVDGHSGRIYAGSVPSYIPEPSQAFDTIMSWADEFKTLKIRANASSLEDAITSSLYGAEGIGLCKSEMFFAKKDMTELRTMFLTEDEEEQKRAKVKLTNIYKEKIKQIFDVMEESPVTIRLIEPIIYNLFSMSEDDSRKLAEQFDMSYSGLKNKISNMSRHNPLLGFKPLNMEIRYIELVDMQIRGIMLAAAELKEERELKVNPEIMIPLVGMSNEFQYIKNLIDRIAKEVMEETKVNVNYLLGSLIEVPRVAMMAGDLAKHADFFSFGTTNLTQLVYGFSKEGAKLFNREFENMNLLNANPFERLDIEGVGRLIKLATEQGRNAKASLRLGVCGIQSDNPETIRFCQKIGINHMSCSPYSVPVAKIAAAQAAIAESR